ncbi:hypothetical protein M5K25_002939 [Dendrobium thyrsiflorum]|uniref:Uncharacterized protein n=1 Tax=Dendrobium thyrsiflorum TaxID=117978 RepID=A0ABD0VNT4_DENTH
MIIITKKKLYSLALILVPTTSSSSTTQAFEAFNKENSFNKNIQPSTNPIFCQWVDRVDRVQSIKSNDFKVTPRMAVLNGT